MMSNWPPLVAMSVVTRWRSTFSSSTTQFELVAGGFSSNFGDSFCMMIMSALLTVAMVTSAACASALAPEQGAGERRNEFRVSTWSVWPPLCSERLLSL